MTCIIHGIKTKKDLRLAVAEKPESVWIEDPSIFAPRTFTVAEIPAGREEVVTNHPKRSWFAQVGRKADGTLYVK